MALKILCDFDGTVSQADTTDAIFTRFAPAWLEIEAMWEAGEIGSSECMRRQVELMDVSLPELDETLDELEIDPTFPAFVQFCQASRFELIVVSDGVDYFIRRMLQRAGLARLPVRANQLIQRGERRFSLGHPHKVQNCVSGAGTCKCASAAPECAPRQTMLIGDARSDFCVSHKAGIVFAKKSLLRYTREHGIAAFEYSSFTDVQAILEGLPASRFQRELGIAC
ncbi:MAG: MtnX-like HAD-IB family phosphatase [Rhodomicrobium sp.]|nr:MtnX-like HAD-IB family phosphatase [Rhodomicrobium sp.]